MGRPIFSEKTRLAFVKKHRGASEQDAYVSFEGSESLSGRFYSLLYCGSPPFIFYGFGKWYMLRRFPLGREYVEQPPKYRDRPFDLEQPFVDCVHEEFISNELPAPHVPPTQLAFRAGAVQQRRTATTTTTTTAITSSAPSAREPVTPSSAVFRFYAQGHSAPGPGTPSSENNQQGQQHRTRPLSAQSPLAPADSPALSFRLPPVRLPAPSSTTSSSSSPSSTTPATATSLPHRSLAPSLASIARPSARRESGNNNDPPSTELRGRGREEIVRSLQEGYELDRTDAESLYERLVTVQTRLQNSYAAVENDEPYQPSEEPSQQEDQEVVHSLMIPALLASLRQSAYRQGADINIRRVSRSTSPPPVAESTYNVELDEDDSDDDDDFDNESYNNGRNNMNNVETNVTDNEAVNSSSTNERLRDFDDSLLPEGADIFRHIPSVHDAVRALFRPVEEDIPFVPSQPTRLLHQDTVSGDEDEED
jgi:hypothetical protein